MSHVDSAVFNFGEADSNAVVLCSFRIRNVGSADLRVLRVRTDCECSKAEVDKTVIPRGDSAEVKVAYHAPDRGGPVSSRVVVETNDPKAEYIRLGIMGRVCPRLQVVPATLDFGTVSGDEVDIPSRSATLYTWSGEPASLEDVRCAEDWIETTFIPDGRQGKVLGELTVRICRAPPGKSNKATVLVRARSGSRTVEEQLSVLVDAAVPPVSAH
jgi:hypothetical protein